MKNRLEFKYRVPVACLDRLRADVLRYLEPDPFAAARPNHEYTVRSVYLDSPDYGCYYEKLDGVRTRKKFRVRGYNEGGPGSQVFLEIKRKEENFIAKDRAMMPFSSLHEVLSDRLNTEKSVRELHTQRGPFFYYYQLRRLEPKVLVVYDREPFECKFGSQLRVTFDKDLRSKVVTDTSRLFEVEGFRRQNAREFILEVKFYQVLPQWIKHVLEKYDLTRTAVSKYTSALDAHNTALLRCNRVNRSLFYTSGTA
ncbi:MAG: polyphosphate polymerase domain-containing protein [Bacteroidetes bacterium]|nr:polyphosphate polymerase domain-containing protein [Bacteroidota bacterium]